MLFVKKIAIRMPIGKRASIYATHRVMNFYGLLDAGRLFGVICFVVRVYCPEYVPLPERQKKHKMRNYID